MALNILQLGLRGQLATELLRRGPAAGHVVRAVGRPGVDLLQPETVRRAILEAPAVDVVINAAAYTAVDLAESEPEKSFTANAESVAAAAEACRERGVPLLHVSTDYVYDGSKTTAYVETDPVGPANVYGHSKLAGEKAIAASGARHVILRTSWVFSATGSNFVKTMLRLGAERDLLTVIDDQQGCPTNAGDIADALLSIAGRMAARPDASSGVYNFCGEGPTTWRRFAEAIFAHPSVAGTIRAAVQPIPTSAYPTPASRPANSVMDCAKIGRDWSIHPRPWRDGLDEVMQALSRERTAT